MTESKKDKVKIRCPECSKYIYGITLKNGAVSCKCPHCNVVVVSKEHNGKEKLIKVKFCNNVAI